MITPEAALTHLFQLITPIGTETVELEHAAGRILRMPVTAQRDQPPFAASSMDGYAVRGPVSSGTTLHVIGAAPAGHGFVGCVGLGEAVRIFTGAPIPDGADRVVIQEDVMRDGDTITLRDGLDTGPYIRPQGSDFSAGDQISAPRRLRPVELALLAAMNCAQVTVSRRADVAIIPTGDELVMPGDTPRADQIIMSNAFAIKAIAESEGARARILPIAGDNENALRAVLDLATGADLIITIGGASVGEHDLVGPVTRAMGGTQSFYKIAMRPGKPLMAGRLGGAVLLGLPGNPVSSIVCAHLFLRPALRAMQGLGAWPLSSATAQLACDLPPNGARAHYLRATLGPEGTITPLPRQDSALLSVMASADALLVQPPHCPGQPTGASVRFIKL